MRYGRARVAVLLGGVLALVPAAAPGADGPALAWPAEVTCPDDRVTLHATGAPLAEVIGRVAAACDVTQYGTLDGTASIDVALDDVPVAAAFDRLLGTGNFTLRYRGDRVVGIRVLWAAGPPTPAPAPATLAPAPETSVGTLAPSGTPTAAWEQEIVLGRKLAGVLGRDRAAVQTLLQTAFTHRRPIVRRQAMRTLFRAAERDPELLALFRDYQEMDASAAAALARQGLGDGANRSLRLVLSSLTDPQLRQQMQQVLGALRSPPAP